MKHSNALEMFLEALRQTSELVSYFPGGFDFEVNSFDPVIEDILELAEEDGMTVEELLGDPSDDGVYDIIFNHAPRLITDRHRLILYEMLCDIEKHAPKKHRKCCFSAKIGLEDATMNPCLQGLVFQLFLIHTVRKSRERSVIESTPCDPDLLALVEKASTGGDRESAEKIKSLGEGAMSALEDYYCDNELEKETLANFMDILAFIPGFRSALLLLEILRRENIGADRMASMIEKSPVRSSFLIHLKNEHNKFMTDPAFRQRIQEFLLLLGEPEAFHFLRRELLKPESWISHVSSEDMPDYYGTVVKRLIGTGDRRSVPALIKFLIDGASHEIPEKALREAKSLIEGSTWHNEIVQSLKLVKEGEKVFVGPAENLTKIALERLEQFKDFHTLMQGKPPTLDDLNRRLKIEQGRFNTAYHDDLDGLRPVDMARPPLKALLMERMLNDFEKHGNSAPHALEEEGMSAFAEFQSEWLLAPLPDHDGQAPEVIIMSELERHSLSRAEREYFESYRKEKINDLYVQASGLFVEKSYAEAQRRVDVILKLEPAHLFAARLGRLLQGRSIPKALDSPGDEEKRETPRRLDILKPFFADVLFSHREGFRGAITGEVDSLRSRGIQDPVIDDQQFRFFNEYATNSLLEYKKQNLTPLGTMDQEEWATLARSLEMEYFTMVNFGLFGDRVFYIAPRLAERLMETDMNVEGTLLRLPFKSCAFVYQDSQFIQLFHRCFCDESLVPEYDSPVSVFLTEFEREGRRSLIIVAARASSSFRYYGIAQRTLYLNDAATVEEVLRTDWKALRDETDEGAMPDSFFYDDLRIAFFRTIINSVLYLSSGNADMTPAESPLQDLIREEKDLKSRRRREKLEKKKNRTKEACSSYAYILVGKTAPETELSRYYMKEDCAKWRTLAKRFMVRGHWKHQAHGKEMKERRLIWIQPYYKGPVNVAEAISRPYIVEE